MMPVTSYMPFGGSSAEVETVTSISQLSILEIWCDKVIIKEKLNQWSFVQDKKDNR